MARPICRTAAARNVCKRNNFGLICPAPAGARNIGGVTRAHLASQARNSPEAAIIALGVIKRIINGRRVRDDRRQPRRARGARLALYAMRPFGRKCPIFPLLTASRAWARITIVRRR